MSAFFRRPSPPSSGDGAPVGGLERSYRRLLRLYPSRWRRHREEEVLAVLLQSAAPGQAAATAAERRDLLLAAGREHGRAGQRAARDAPGRTAALVTLIGGTAYLLAAAGAPLQVQPASLPPQLPAYSYVTQSVSTSPPGPAVAAYRHGNGVEFADFPQAVVVGAGGSVRRLDLAENRDEAMQSSPGSFLLSPDGSHVASGRYDLGGRADIAIQDLSTGKVSTTASLGYPSVAPVAWSPDGTSVIASLGALPWLAPEDQPVHVPPARLVLVGLDGDLLPLPPGVSAEAGQVAWAPDGHRLVVQGADQELAVVDAATGASRPLGVRANLAGTPPWSPDGALLATSGACSPEGQVGPSTYDVVVVPVDASGSTDGAAPTCIPVGVGNQPVGWAAPRVLVLSTTTESQTGAEQQALVAVDIDEGSRTELTAIPKGSGNYHVGDVQVPPAALSGSLGPRPQSPLVWDRGPLARWPAVVLVASVVGVLVAMTAAVGRRLGSRLDSRSGAAGGPEIG
ncbi:hypothetical protein [Streptomyces sp. NP160]|uniref:hypothetical protein n=1 Tax=Streptomyces sp. NP160 TaxID=2586637 RepID=UPI0015D59272|nr:hypothetical protein [Streptomyces sp. NP160]